MFPEYAIFVNLLPHQNSCGIPNMCCELFLILLLVFRSLAVLGFLDGFCTPSSFGDSSAFVSMITLERALADLTIH